MRHFGERLDVGDVAGRVADRLAEDGAGVFVDQLLDILGPVAGGDAALDALLRQDMGEHAWWCHRAAAR